MKKIFFFISLLALSFQNFATESSRFSIPISSSVGIGKMKNTNIGLPSRTMSALSLEALPSYIIGPWQLGMHIDYRWQGQLSSLNDSGGTNLKGHGHLIGLGIRHNFTNRFFTQGSVDFIGEYDFSKDTSSNQDDKITKPISIRWKTGYAPIESFSNFTVDFDFQFISFNKIHISSTERSSKTSQLMAYLGLTYSFGRNTNTSEETSIKHVSELH